MRMAPPIHTFCTKTSVIITSNDRSFDCPMVCTDTIHMTIHKRSCGKVMFLHLSASHSVHGGCLSQCMLEYTPPRRLTPAGRHPLGRPPLQCILGYTPRLPNACCNTPPWPVHAGIDMATAAGGRHNTGMHSCSHCYFVR